MYHNSSDEVARPSVPDQTRVTTMLKMIAEGHSNDEIAEATQISRRNLKIIRRLLEATVNDSQLVAEELIELCNAADDTPQALLFELDHVSEEKIDHVLGISDEIRATDDEACADTGPRVEAQHLLKIIEESLSPDQMHALANTLMRLADALDSQWRPDNLRSRFFWGSKAAAIERNALRLAAVGLRYQENARRREKFLPPKLLGEPAWNMLVELFVQFAGSAKVSTKSLCLVSGCPDTTCLRIIDKLVAAGLITREPSSTDKRVTFVELTKPGVIAVGSALEALQF